MNIAIYDSGNHRGEQLLQRVRQYWRDRQITCDTVLYSDVQQLCCAFRACAADLTFLFLGTDPAADFAAVQALREISLTGELIFVADTPEFVAEAASYRAMGYLAWPLPDDALDEALRRFLRDYSCRPHRYAVHTRRSDCLVPHDQILYFRSDGHFVHVHVSGQSEPLTHLRRLNDIQREVAVLPYVRCHQSYLVNCRAVERVEGRFLVLRDGTRLPVSRRYGRDVVINVKMEMELHNISQKNEEQC